MLTGLVCVSDRYIPVVIQNKVFSLVTFPVIFATPLYKGTTLLHSICNIRRRPLKLIVVNNTGALHHTPLTVPTC